MRKLFALFSMTLLMLMSVLVTSCSQKEQVSTSTGDVSYSVNVVGIADDNVQFQWVNNTFVFHGATQFNVEFYNDTTFVHKFDAMNDPIVTLDDALESNGDYPPDIVAAANRINEQIKAKVDKASGDYDFRVSGYLQEKVTGMVLYIDRRFTSNDTLSTLNQ